MMRGTLLAAAATTAALALPTIADAATSVELGSSRLTVIGDIGRNDIEVRRVSDGYLVSDPDAALEIVPGSQCFFTDPPHEVRCETGGEVELTIEGRAAADELTVVGGSQRAVIDGGDGTDRLVGGPGPDRLRGGPNGDEMLGNAGNDVLLGEAGPDSLRGGAGTDSASYADRGPAGVVVTLPVDAFDVRADDGNLVDGPVDGLRDAIFEDVENVIGGDGPDRMLGNNARNGLQGRGGADTLSGRGGNDALDGGVGPDVLNGNDGIDVAVYDDRTAPLVLSLDDVANDGNATEDALITGSFPGAPTADNIRADVEGVIGGEGPDAITGNVGANRLDGGDGDDTIDGRAGADTIDAGPGDDALDGGTGPDVIGGGLGEDTLTYETRIDAVRVTLDGVADDGNALDAPGDNAGDDIENVIGTIGDDLLRGNDRANTLDGRVGDDQLEGLTSNDVLRGGAGSDVLDGGPGIDTASFAGGPARQVTLDGLANDAAIGPTIGPDVDNALTENVIGSSSDDIITGDDQRNVLEGGGGDDTIRGLGGNDDIAGDAGGDALSGDAGQDLLRANDGVRDQVSCGADLDNAQLDLKDADANVKGGAALPASSGCEQQSVAPAGRLPNVAVARIVRISHGRARVTVRCPRASHVRCAGTARLQRFDGTLLARGRFALRRGRHATLVLGLRRPAGRGAAQVLARERDADGRAKVTLARVKLRRS
jgi:Ca2+-binding RTX toxin-like protein